MARSIGPISVVPSLSTTFTPLSGTSPVLVTSPETLIVFVPNSIVGSQVLVTLMPGVVVTVVVQLAVELTDCRVQMLVPVAVTVSVNGPQPTATVMLPV